MTKDQATALVDGWVKDWRPFLDGSLHWKPRADLIERLSAMPDEPTTEEPKRRGRPPIKAAAAIITDKGA